MEGLTLPYLLDKAFHFPPPLHLAIPYLPSWRRRLAFLPSVPRFLSNRHRHRHREKEKKKRSPPTKRRTRDLTLSPKYLTYNFPVLVTVWIPFEENKKAKTFLLLRSISKRRHHTSFAHTKNNSLSKSYHRQFYFEQNKYKNDPKKNFNNAGGGAPPKNLFRPKATRRRRRSKKSTCEV